ncbi:hypothetical protein ACHAXM_006636 [Skeletonema potamos]
MSERAREIEDLLITTDNSNEIGGLPQSPDPEDPFPLLPLLPHPWLEPLFPDFPELLGTQDQWPPHSGGLCQSPDPAQSPDPEPDLPLFPLLLPAHSPTDAHSSLTTSSAPAAAIVINAVAN